MKATYKRLWKLLIDKEMKKMELCEKANISTTSIGKLAKGKNVGIDILIKICTALDCGLDDIMELIPDENETDKK